MGINKCATRVADYKQIVGDMEEGQGASKRKADEELERAEEEFTRAAVIKRININNISKSIKDILNF